MLSHDELMARTGSPPLPCTTRRGIVPQMLETVLAQASH